MCRAPNMNTVIGDSFMLYMVVLDKFYKSVVFRLNAKSFVTLGIYHNQYFRVVLCYAFFQYVGKIISPFFCSVVCQVWKAFSHLLLVMCLVGIRSELSCDHLGANHEPLWHLCLRPFLGLGYEGPSHPELRPLLDYQHHLGAHWGNAETRGQRSKFTWR